MLFRKSLFVLLITSAMCSAAIAQEPEKKPRPTISLGYAHGYIKDFGNVDGGNFRLQNDINSQWGIMVSLTGMKHSWQDEFSQCKKSDTDCRNRFKERHKMDKKGEYFSVLAGPSFRLSDNMSVFALVGASHTEIEKPNPANLGHARLQNKVARSSNQLAYSAGITFNPIDNVALTAGYEGSRATFDDRKHPVNGVFLDIGYRF